MMLTSKMAQALQELEKREAAASSLSAYASFCLDVTPALHHRYVCDALDGLLADEYDELIINAPPGSAKSTYTSHALPAYFLGKYPESNVILGTHTADLSERWSRKVRNTLSAQAHGNVFPRSELSKDSTAVSRWATTAGGELLAAGVGGSILGFRADLGVLDDPISGFEQAQSVTQLTKIHAWYETDFVTRLKPGAKTVLICQRLSPNDLAGYLITRNILSPTKRQRLIILHMEAEENDVLGRQAGARLWPEWYTPEMVADAKRDEFKWQTLYQQQPPSESGSWVSTEDIQFRPSPPVTPTTVTYGMTDLALSVNTGDYTVHMVVAIDDKGDWDILHVERGRVDSSASATTLVNLCATYDPREWLVDDDNATKVWGALVQTCAQQRQVRVPWKMLPMRGQNKETRAAGTRGQFKRRKVFLPASTSFTNWLVAELLAFPNAVGQGVDDGVDALGLLGRRLAVISPPAKVIPIRPGLTIQDMTLDQLYEDNPTQALRRF